MSTINVAIVGASGSIGKILLTSLLASGRFTVTALTRESSSASFPAGVKVTKTDFSHASLVAAFKGQEAIISTVGATGFTTQTDLVDAAIAAGVPRFFPSEFSTSSQDDAILELLPLFAVKRDLITYLKSKEDQIAWTGIAASGLFDWGLQTGFIGYDLAKKEATIWDSGDKRFTLTNEGDLGQAVVSALLRPAETKNRYLFISSVETTQNEVLAALEAATGKWTVKTTTSAKEIAAGREMLGKGDMEGAFKLVRAGVYSDLPVRANYAKDEVLANDVLGLKGESVESSVRRAVA